MKSKVSLIIPASAVEQHYHSESLLLNSYRLQHNQSTSWSSASCIPIGWCLNSGPLPELQSLTLISYTKMVDHMVVAPRNLLVLDFTGIGRILLFYRVWHPGTRFSSLPNYFRQTCGGGGVPAVASSYCLTLLRLHLHLPWAYGGARTYTHRMDASTFADVYQWLAALTCHTCIYAWEEFLLLFYDP